MNLCDKRLLAVLSFLALFLASSSAFAATLTVTSSLNSGAGSLRATVGASSDGDVIVFDESISLITLSSEIEIATTLTITGPAADELTISGGSSARIFYVLAPGKTVNLNRMRLENGRSQAAPVLNSIAGGGAIYHSSGILNIDECEFSGNVADDGNGSTSFGYGGAIASQSELHVSNTLFTNNSLNNANAYGGGAVYCQDNTTDHDVSFNNCTFTGNSVINGNAGADGGAIAISENTGSGTDTAPLVTITSCTFYDNNSNNNGEEIYIFTQGPDVSITLQNNIFDRNAADGSQVSVECDCATGITATSNGGNIYWDTPDAQIPTAGTRDQTAQGIDGSGLTGTLGSNGGSTRTIPITSGASLADDNGVSGGPVLARDQRNFLREGNPDSGAFEFNGTPTFYTIFPTDNSTDVSVTTNLVVTFEHNVTLFTGNLSIHRVSDDSLVEQIAATSATGDGTKIITFDPVNPLPGNTALYVNYTAQAFQAPRGELHAAVTGNSTWNFTTGAAPNLPPVIATTNTVIAGRTGDNVNIYVTVSDPESATSEIVLTGTSSNVGLVPDNNIQQLGLTSATTCFRVTTAGLSTFGTVQITITATDTSANTASTTFTITFLPTLPTALSFDGMTSLDNQGFNLSNVSGFGNRFIIQVHADANRESDNIIVTTGTFNAFDQNSAPNAVVQTQYSLFTGFGQTGVGDGAGPAPATFGPSVATTSNSIRLQLRDRVARGANLTLSTAAGGSVGLSSTTITLTLLLPPAVQLGLTSTHGTTSGDKGDGIGNDGFNGGVTNFAGTTTVPVTLASLDAANWITATGNSTFPIFFFTTTVSVTSDNPDVVLSGAGISYTFSPLAATQTRNLTITYNGMGTTTAVITYQHDGSMGSTSVTITIDPADPVIATSNTAVSMLEDISTRIYVSVFDAQSATSAIVLSAESGVAAIIGSDNIVQTGATTAVTCFLVTTASANTNGSVSITISGIDPDGNIGSTEFSISVIPVNDAPSFTTGANAVVEEGAASYDLPFATGISDGDPEVVQALTFHLVILENPALFATQPTVATTNGNLRFGVAAATTGTAIVRISLSDNGGTANGGVNTTGTQTFTITVNNLNDAPVFSTGSNVTVNEDSGPYDQPFATGIDDGDPSTTQVLTFHVVATNSSLFSVQPSIAVSTGNLSFTPASNANGITEVQVSLSDDGPNGGSEVNTSATQSFFITINPVNDPPSITSIADQTFSENGTTTVSFSIDDIDDLVGSLNVSATSSNMSLVTSGGFSFSPTASNMTMTVRPSCGETGVAVITVTVTDGGAPALTSTAVFSVTVTPAPAFEITGGTEPCPRISVQYDIPSTPGATYEWDVTNGILVSGQGTTNATINWESGTTGSVRATIITPAGCTFSSLLIITTLNISANPDYAITATGASVTFNVLTNDDGSTLVLIGATDPAHGTLSTNANGNVTYTPDGGFEGYDSFNYTIRDANGCLETGASVQVVVSDQVDRINLFYVESQKDKVGPVRGMRNPRGTAVSPDGNHVYVAGQADNSIVIFEREAADGTLTYVDRARHNVDGVQSMRYPTGVVVSPDGKHVYVASYGSGAVVSFTRNSGTGGLTYLERKLDGKLDAGKKIVGISRAIELTISRDGKSLYVTGYTDNSVVLFRRDVNTGLLQFVERHKDGSGGVDGLRYPLGLDVSPDGKNVYVAGSADDAVAVFARDNTTGKLTWRQKVEDGNGGVDGIADAADVAVSSDGEHVYVAGYGDEAIAAFSRDSNGDLTFIHKVSGGLLDGIASLEASPNGTHIFGAAEIDDALVVLERDAATGELTYLEGLRDGVDGVDGLKGARFVAISPDGFHLYTAGYDDKAVSVAYRNRQPVAHDDATSVNPSSSVEVTVLDNDNEKDDGESLEVTAKTDGTLGTVAITGGGTKVEYTAGAATGNDTFTYTIEDGKGGSSTATVAVNVSSSTKRGFEVAGAANDERISLHPNPVRDAATILLNGMEGRNITVRVYDMQGRRVAELFRGEATNNMQLTWNAGAFNIAAGSYSLVVESALETGAVERLQQRMQIVH